MRLICYVTLFSAALIGCGDCGGSPPCPDGGYCCLHFGGGGLTFSPPRECPSEPCKLNPCGAHQACNDESGEAVCSCAPGYTGYPNCTPVDSCTGIVCESTSSLCHESTGVCHAGGICYYEPKPVDTPCDDGDPCTQSDSCDGAGACVGRNPNTCSGNGTCNPDGGTCECNSTHTGPSCAACAPDCYDYPTCTYCHAQTTCNGHGACNPDGTCQCAGNWTGPDCKICPEPFCGGSCEPSPTITDVRIDCSSTGGDCITGGFLYPVLFESSGVTHWSATTEVMDGGGTPGSLSPSWGTISDGGITTTTISHTSCSDGYNTIRITVTGTRDGGCPLASGSIEYISQ